MVTSMDVETGESTASVGLSGDRYTMAAIRQQSEPIVLRMAHAIARYIGFGEDMPAPEPTVTGPAQTVEPVERSRPRLSLVRTSEPVPAPGGHKWQRHARLREYKAPLPNDVRIARQEAVRGLYSAHAGAIEVAIQHFALAAQCDDVDLTAVPGFWQLTRGQMQAAVRAYEQVGRYRDAAALDAHIATIFRPSLVGARVQPVRPRASHKQAAST